MYKLGNNLYFQAWIFGAFVIGMSLIVIDATTGGVSDCVSDIAAAALSGNVTVAT